MKSVIALSALVLLPSIAWSAKAMPGDRELLAAYCSVIINKNLSTVTQMSNQLLGDTQAPAEIKAKVTDALSQLQDKRRRLDSYLNPVMVAALESEGSSYVLALLAAQDRAESDLAAIRGTGAAAKEAVRRGTRCSDLSWLP